ncbi:MAG: 2-phospho-L-lactate guanylyltransferase [Betaproteobacteria bacterium]|nr:2-phospho-L-lactate guanylyltransferase [Betaproteobacteria bacterium]
MSLWLIIPIRGLASGKSRLADILSPLERKQFNTACLDRALDAFSQTQGTPARSIVVSPEDDALAHAGARGAVALREHSVGNLNGALLQASDLARQKGAARLLILAADLPLISAQALTALINSSDPAGVQIIVDKTGSGTNALLLPVSAAQQFYFGENSLSKHRAVFTELGYRTTIWRDDSLAFDIDTPEDLGCWLELKLS